MQESGAGAASSASASFLVLLELGGLTTQNSCFISRLQYDGDTYGYDGAFYDGENEMEEDEEEGMEEEMEAERKVEMKQGMEEDSEAFEGENGGPLPAPAAGGLSGMLGTIWAAGLNLARHLSA